MVGEADSPIPEGLRPALAELEAYLDGEPPEKLAELVLVLASTWVLGDAGFDLDRYYAEAKTFYDVTPEHDRVLNSFPDAMGYYLALRLTMTEADEVDGEAAHEKLGAARAALALRAEWVEADYPLIAEGFRRLLDETRGSYERPVERDRPGCPGRSRNSAYTVSAARTRVGVNGSWRSRLPVASKIALPIAEGAFVISTSPAPTAGWSFRSMIWNSNAGMWSNRITG